MTNNYTVSFGGWGFREMDMAGEILRVYSENGDSGLVGGEVDGEISLGFNTQSGCVYMSDENLNTWMMNNGKLELFVTLESGNEEFLTDLINMDKNLIEEEDREQVNELKKEYSYLLKQ